MSGPVPPELQAKISLWRQKSVEGTLTLEEMKEAIKAMRAGRVSAASASESSSKRSKVKAAIPSADEMLNELGEL